MWILYLLYLVQCVTSPTYFKSCRKSQGIMPNTSLLPLLRMWFDSSLAGCRCIQDSSATCKRFVSARWQWKVNTYSTVRLGSRTPVRTTRGPSLSLFRRVWADQAETGWTWKPVRGVSCVPFIIVTIARRRSHSRHYEPGLTDYSRR